MMVCMHSSYQHHATSYANLSLASAHAIVNDLGRRAHGLAPRFSEETGDAGCTNLRPGNDQPRRQQVWDMHAEALSWNLIADHADLVIAAKLAEDRGADYEVGCTYGRGEHFWVKVDGEIVAEYKDSVQTTIEEYEAAGIAWVSSGGKVWPAEVDLAVVRTAAREDTLSRTGAGRWLDLIHAVNRIAPGTFGNPVIEAATDSTPYTEVYPDAKVLFPTDEEVVIRSRTDHGARLIRQAAAALGLEVSR